MGVTLEVGALLALHMWLNLLLCAGHVQDAHPDRALQIRYLPIAEVP